MIKLDIQKCNNLIDRGFSLITATADKVPVGSWKQAQQKLIQVYEALENVLLLPVPKVEEPTLLLFVWS